jgi:general secretion pathway protein K
MNSRCDSARAQRGAALVVALLVVAMVALLATALSSDFLLMFRRVENQLHNEQAYAYMLGAESFARYGLLADLQTADGKKVDYVTEGWDQELTYPTDYGVISGQLEDAQGRFNLNALTPGQVSGGKPGLSETQLQLLRLLQTLPLEESLNLDQAQALVEAISDWIDADDDVTGLGGAESQYYADAEPAGRAAGRAMVSPSELMWVKGMTPEIYRALAPLVTVWPNKTTGGDMKINVNTALPQVLACLGDDKEVQPLTENDVEQLVQERTKQKFFESVDAFRTSSVLQGKNIFIGDLAVRSNYFVLTVQTEMQGHRYSLHSLLYRDSDRRTVRVIARTFGDW